MGPDSVRGIAHQDNPAFVPVGKGWHVVDWIVALNHLDMIEDLGVGARIIRMEGADFLCVLGRIIDFFIIGLISSIGIEPIEARGAK